MCPNCEIVAQKLLPLFRSLVAEKLIEKYGFTQSEAAERLGTTQPAISQYISMKRGRKSAEKFKKSLPIVKALADKTAKRIVIKNLKGDEAISSFCEICKTLQK